MDPLSNFRLRYHRHRPPVWRVIVLKLPRHSLPENTLATPLLAWHVLAHSILSIFQLLIKEYIIVLILIYLFGLFFNVFGMNKIYLVIKYCLRISNGNDFIQIFICHYCFLPSQNRYPNTNKFKNNKGEVSGNCQKTA